MRTRTVAALLLVPLLAGCFGGEGEEETLKTVLDPDAIVVPDGAELVEEDSLWTLLWRDAALPAEFEFETPEGATIARATVDLPGDRNSLWLVNAETGRRRCNPETVSHWGRDISEGRSCSALTVVDEPGTLWKVQVGGGGSTDVRVVFEDGPLDGLAAMVDVDRLSHLEYELEPTQTLQIESFDGTLLWAELTLPVGKGPWPTIISASPYNVEGPRNEPAMWTYWSKDWAMRGYAVLNVDVRGFANSNGCVEVWGHNEQMDQVATVEWVADQPWSDGTVGFYGQSYVGTTPVEAAVYAPDALKAIIAVAPVINAYDDWHYGGVPNGESIASPALGYQGSPLLGLTEGANPIRPEDPIESSQHLLSNLCDPTLTARANDPRHVYNEFYVERDFKAKAGDVTAAVMFTQGFEDANVKSQMIPGWFNELAVPKLGLFGHWVHQHPPRADGELLMLAWMDQYVKGKDLGLEDLPAADVLVDRDTHRTTNVWPDLFAKEETFGADFTAGTFTAEGGGSVQMNAVPVGGDSASVLMPATQTLTLTLETPLAFSGNVLLHLEGTMDLGENAHLAANLYEETDEGRGLITYGMVNLAHRGDHTQWMPYTPTETINVDLPFLPTERVLPAGTVLVVELLATQANLDLAIPHLPAVLTLQGGADATALVFPTVPLWEYEPAPATTKP